MSILLLEIPQARAPGLENGSGIRIPKCAVVHSMPISDARLDHLHTYYSI